MKKKLVIINGVPGVGKTATCREIQSLLDRSVWLDGDWCWMANPWIVTDENSTGNGHNILLLSVFRDKLSSFKNLLYFALFYS